MRVVKTVKIPVHYATTKRKLDILNKLTARLTYGVYLWSRIIGANDIHTRNGLRKRKFEQEVRKQTGPSAGFIQCCADTALWMWKSYRELHKEWERRVKQAQRKGNERWLKKLMKREPQPPLSNGIKHKIPIWFDYRVGSLEVSETIKLAAHLVRTSTLKRGERITVLLNPAKYHLDLLERGEIKSFQIVKRGEKFHVHVKVEYEVQDQLARAIRGVDLGIKRSAATVLLRPDEPLRRGDFSVIRDGEKTRRLNELNKRVGAATVEKVGSVEADTEQAQARRGALRPPDGQTDRGDLKRVHGRDWISKGNQVRELSGKWNAEATASDNAMGIREDNPLHRRGVFRARHRGRGARRAVEFSDVSPLRIPRHRATDAISCSLL